MVDSRYLLVHPVLHASGFGNQVGMLLQHVALAALTNTTLVLPAIQQPEEHRDKREKRSDMYSIPSDRVFNLSSFAPLANVLSPQQLLSSQPSLTLPEGDAPLPTFSFGVKHRPLQLPAVNQPQARVKLPTLSAVTKLLTQQRICEEGASHQCVEGISAQPIVYCHLSRCRDHTRRACRHLPDGCTRTSQRLPNNYLFSHRLTSLLCEGGGDTATATAPASDVDATAITLDQHERAALRSMKMAGWLRAAAAAIASDLGPYLAIHVRLRDAASKHTDADADAIAASSSDDAGAGSSSSSSSKGLLPSELPALFGKLARRLTPADFDSHEKKRGSLTLYIASNRPKEVRKVMGQIGAEVTRGLASSAVKDRQLLVRDWLEMDLDAAVAAAKKADASFAPPAPGKAARLSGLRAALVEHELCVTAPNGFVGSPFSTWANLIGARRLAKGGYAPSHAYADLHTGASVPACVVTLK